MYTKRGEIWTQTVLEIAVFHFKLSFNNHLNDVHLLGYR